MTDLLEKAFRAASQLTDADQDQLAAQVLEDLRADSQWEAKFAATADGLAALAAEALAEHRAGKTAPMSNLDVKNY
jgi:hypothetical protein